MPEMKLMSKPKITMLASDMNNEVSSTGSVEPYMPITCPESKICFADHQKESQSVVLS